MKLFVLAVCLAVVIGDHDTPTEADAFCSLVNIFANPVIQDCQNLRAASSIQSKVLPDHCDTISVLILIE